MRFRIFGYGNVEEGGVGQVDQKQSNPRLKKHSFELVL